MSNVFEERRNQMALDIKNLTLPEKEELFKTLNEQMSARSNKEYADRRLAKMSSDILVLINQDYSTDHGNRYIQEIKKACACLILAEVPGHNGDGG